MRLLKKIILIMATLLSGAVAQASVFQVNNIELKFNKFNAQKIRSYAVDVATQRGFEKLLTNIVPQEYDVKSLLDSIDLKKVDVVEKLNIVNEVNSNGKYEATFDILYSSEKIKKILKEKRVPFIQETMGKVLLLAINQDPTNQEYELFGATNNFRDLLFKGLEDSLLITPVLPNGDLQEITTYNPQNVLDSNNEDKVLELAKKYNSDKSIIILLQQNNYEDKSLYQVTIKYLNFSQLKEENFIVLGQTIDQVVDEISLKIKTIWQQNNLLEFNKPKRFLAMVNTAENLPELYSLIKQMQKLNVVSSVKIKQITTQYAFIQTDFYGTPQEFLTAAEKAGLRIYQNENAQWLVEGRKINAAIIA